MSWGKCALALILTAWVGLSARPIHAIADPSDHCGRGWIYFDLGNTIIDTSNWEKLKYVTQAHAYLLELKSAGFHLGLITNVPETWGATPESKLSTLKQTIAQSWTDATPFGWNDFEDILLPPSDINRKPAPYLFAKALHAHPGCLIAYEGEDAIEVRAALDAGFTSGYVVGSDSSQGFFLPADQIFPQP